MAISEATYAPGDVVTVRKDLNTCTRYAMFTDAENSNSVVRSMLFYCGRKVHIAKYVMLKQGIQYSIIEDDGVWGWTDEMFECAPEEDLVDSDISWEEFFLS